MLNKKMYVRCPADLESFTDPRVVICGQVKEIDEFKGTAKITVNDPFGHIVFFENLPKKEIEVPIKAAQHCTLFVGSLVVYRPNCARCSVLCYTKGKDGFYYYHLQDVANKTVFKTCETDIIAPFNNGRVDPAEQLKNYEFQNPSWYIGHAVVSKSMNVLDNSIYGFKNLAGAKIFLLPHQVNTIMRCLQDEPCRYMLADEVGMGKTIEAISILKIYMQDRSHKNALIIVPETLKEQWLTELFFKFDIETGTDKNHNTVNVKSLEKVTQTDLIRKWDFVIIDEIHRYLKNEEYYGELHTISINATNILLLSATPVQQRKEEYLSLLRLLQPSKYDTFTVSSFEQLLEKQNLIIQSAALTIDDLEDLDKELNDALEKGEDPHESEDCQDLFEEIYERLESICEKIDDKKLTAIFEKIQFEKENLSVYDIKLMLSYICNNYQIESNIIRNRRRLLESVEDNVRLLPTREMIAISYDLDNERNTYESLVYEYLSNWIVDNARKENEEDQGMSSRLLSAFFSSPWAFSQELERAKRQGAIIDDELIKCTTRWVKFENTILETIAEIVEDPDRYKDYYSTRLMTVLSALYEDYYDQKVVLFTNYEKTFQAYKKVLEKLFSMDYVSFFGEGLEKDELEVNAYRFQNEETCRVMLCDYTGGEGRNFQCADYVLHIDLPWDANAIEQRIGRLDRLERDQARPVVHSIVIYAKETFEEELFNFWNKGLMIFTQSLSGMEIIMNEINHEIRSAIQEDFKYGLDEKIPQIIAKAEEMRSTVRTEQKFDAAGLLYKPMYRELQRLVNYYSRYENALFASTMSNWASLAGFHGKSGKDGTITYSAKSFVPKSAINALLIPPIWNDYINSTQNTFINRVRNDYNKSKAIQTTERSIQGTFIRKKAIENDYLHFFAPGDAVFDCIVNNALHSCKGQSSAFAVISDINWSGVFYTWSLSPDIDYLLSNNVSLYALSQYRNYLMSEQVTIPVSIRNDDNLSDDVILREYSKIIETGFKHKNAIHLGKRGSASGFLKSITKNQSYISWFRSTFPEERWNEVVSSSRKEAVQRVVNTVKKKSQIRNAREEMERILSARTVNAEYYGMSGDDIGKMKETFNFILNAIKKPKLVLESAAFVWMIRESK